MLFPLHEPLHLRYTNALGYAKNDSVGKFSAVLCRTEIPIDGHLIEVVLAITASSSDLGHQSFFGEPWFSYRATASMHHKSTYVFERKPRWTHPPRPYPPQPIPFDPIPPTICRNAGF